MTIVMRHPRFPHAGHVPTFYFWSAGFAAHETVAYSGDGEDQFGFLGILFQLLTEAGDVGVDGSGERVGVVSPDGAEEFVARDGCARAVHQVAEKLEFPGSEIDGLAIACDLAFADVHANGTELVDTMSGVDRSSSQ